MEHSETAQSRARLRTIIAVALAAIAAGAIVAVWLGRSSPQTVLPAPPTTLDLVVHETPRAPVDTPFTTSAGEERDLADFAGRVLLVNLWATWCAPCIREMPALDRAQAALGTDSVAVIAISQDRAGMADVGPFWAEAGMAHIEPYLDKTGAFARAVEAKGLPTTLLIGRDGRELARLEGTAEWDSPAVIAYLEALAAPSRP